MEVQKNSRGRPRLGSPPKERSVRYSSSLPPDIFARLRKYCDDEERDLSYPIRKALEVWLEERGY